MMYEATLREDNTPWYKQQWPWLLIALPASAVLGGIATIIIAVNSPNSLVADDYYKQGLAINQLSHRLRAATALGVQGLLRAHGDRLLLELQSDEALALPDSLRLEFAHATRAELDQSIELTRIDNRLYQAPYPPLPPGSWYIRLRSDALNWELRANTRIDDGLQTRLSGAQ
jgi:hypothetical protein